RSPCRHRLLLFQTITTALASRQATVLTLRQSRHSPDRYGASRRLLTIPSSPRPSASRSSARRSSNGSGASRRARKSGRKEGKVRKRQNKSPQHPPPPCVFHAPGLMVAQTRISRPQESLQRELRVSIYPRISECTKNPLNGPKDQGKCAGVLSNCTGSRTT